jgi:hypothetical protein
MGVVTTGAILGMAAIGTAGNIIASKSASNSQKKAARRAQDRANALSAEMEELELARQEIINPYDDVVSLDDMIVDNTGLLSNPFASLGVATQAAKFQAEEADIALANTLDLLAATGASAGGATALAQAALQSKRGVSASLEAQEAQNNKLAAQGEQFLQQQQMAEAQRVQQAEMTEAQRIQQAEVLGEEFVYGERERRETEQLNRLQAQITGATQVATTERQNAANIMAAGAATSAQILSSGLTTAGSMMMMGGFGGFTPQVTPVNTITPAGVVPVGGGITPTGTIYPGSDIRLKKNIKLIGRANSGLKIYSFEYIDKKYGSHTYQGVMSNEVPKEAVIKGNDGYDLVDYSKLDVEFKRI